MDSPTLLIDARQYNLPINNVAQPTDSQILDRIIHELDTDDYVSIFFLLMDFIGPSNFLYFVKKDKSYLEDKFRNRFYEFKAKNAIFIEIFGTMKRYDLLKVLGTCEHVYMNDKDTLNQVSQLWKCLYSVCDQLTDSDVLYFKDKLFPGSMNDVSYAEELLCEAFAKDIFNENDLKNLKIAFKDRPDCLSLISSYTGAAKLSYYPVKRPTINSHCGIAVIVNHEKFDKPSAANGLLRLPERTGSQKDVELLKRMWKSFGFDTEVYNNYSRNQVVDLFKRLSLMNHTYYDAFVVCYMSHGDEGIVYSSDNKEVRILDLIDLMANKCQTLVNKPKLFFIQACSGRQVQQGMGSSPQSLPSAPGIERQVSRMSLDTPLNSDILLFCSTFPGYVSYRSTMGTSWFIEELVQVMEKYGEELTIMNVVTKVTDGVSKKFGSCQSLNFDNCKQIPICSKTLKYELKLKKLMRPIHLEMANNSH